MCRWGLAEYKDMFFLLKAQENTRARTFWLQDKNFRQKIIFEKGIVCGQLYNDWLMARHSIVLTSKERKELDEYVDLLCRKNDIARWNDKGPATGKNLIIILVESYLTYTSDLLVDGKPVTPRLNDLRHKSDTYFNGNVITNIAIGASFDGQMITLTGLLPLKNRLTLLDMVSMGQINALPHLLKEHGGYGTYISIPHSPTLWSQDKMSSVYDIDTLYSSSNDLQDDELLRRAAEKQVGFKQPFFNLLVTLTTHVPYDRISITPRDNFNFPQSYSPEFCNYLIKCNYMDSAVGEYIDNLKDSGLYDNSVIVIVADHCAFKDYLKMPEGVIEPYTIPIYILNSGMNLEQCWYGTMEQVDVFSTLLDLYGINSKWQGLGCSILDKEKYEDRINEKSYEISEKIIRSDYF